MKILNIFFRSFALFSQKNLPRTNAALHRLDYVAKVCLRLLRKYTIEIYPSEESKHDRNLTRKAILDTDDKKEQAARKVYQ